MKKMLDIMLATTALYNSAELDSIYNMRNLRSSGKVELSEATKERCLREAKNYKPKKARKGAFEKKLSKKQRKQSNKSRM